MNKTNHFVKKWLILAVSALAGAGIYSLPPVLFRGPAFKDILPVEAIFASSLVIHVDLSVLVWMLAIGGMLLSQFYEKKYDILYKASFYAAAIGTVLIALSPLTGNLNPLKNNYIPVLQNPIFFLGLGIFASGILLQIIITMASYRKMLVQPLGYGLYVAAFITLIAFICFVISGVQSPAFDSNDPTSFYEHLFWGGGHILQTSYTTILIVAWFKLLNACGYKNPLPKRLVYLLFGVNLLISLPAPLFYLSDNSYGLFATHMRDFLGFAPFIAGAAVIYIFFLSIFIWKNSKSILSKEGKILRPFLILSIFLFGYGGVLAYMISGVNVTIPAHYHGSIVGITLAFMGLVYYFLPKVGFVMPSGYMARSQPYIYGIGQVMHITGLAVMGGYGALRKDAASSQNIDTILGKVLFFSGGSLAILGGLVFVVVVFMAMRRR
jgi:cytochrome c oxidase subunit I